MACPRRRRLSVSNAPSAGGVYRDKNGVCCWCCLRTCELIDSSPHPAGPIGQACEAVHGSLSRGRSQLPCQRVAVHLLPHALHQPPNTHPTRLNRSAVFSTVQRKLHNNTSPPHARRRANTHNKAGVSRLNARVGTHCMRLLGTRSEHKSKPLHARSQHSSCFRHEHEAQALHTAVQG